MSPDLKTVKAAPPSWTVAFAPGKNADSAGAGAPGLNATQGGVDLPCDISQSILPLSASEQMVAAGVEVLYRLEGEVSKATLVRQLWAAMAHLYPPAGQ